MQGRGKKVGFCRRSADKFSKGLSVYFISYCTACLHMQTSRQVERFLTPNSRYEPISLVSPCAEREFFFWEDPTDAEEGGTQVNPLVGPAKTT